MEKFKYYGYDFHCYYREKNKDTVFNIHNKMKELNVKTHNFNYGLFNSSIKDEEIEEIFSRMVVCLIFLNEEIVGFLTYFVLDETTKIPFFQLGLIVISKNKGVNLFSFSEYTIVKLIFKNVGVFNGSIITTIPKLVEDYCNHVSNTWPHPRKDLSRPPKEYQNLLNLIADNYIKKFFPQDFTINKRRFTLKLDKREIGFHDRFHYLPMAKSFEYNSFCSQWINYEENEDLILIGKFDYKTMIKINISLLLIKIEEKFFIIKGVFNDKVRRYFPKKYRSYF